MGYPRKKMREELKKPRPQKKKDRDEKRKKKKLARIERQQYEQGSSSAAKYRRLKTIISWILVCSNVYNHSFD